MDLGMAVESRRAQGAGLLAKVRSRLPAPIRDVLGSLSEHRAASLAAGAAFYGLLSIPPFLVALVATGALIALALGPEFVDQMTSQILNTASGVLSPEAVADVVAPSISRVLEQPNIGILSVGFLVAIWSSSRMINALFQGIEVLTKQDDERSKVATRLMAVKAMVIGLLVIALLLPILAIGPADLLKFLGASWIVVLIGWLLVTALAVLAVSLFYRMAIPRKPTWKHAAIGASLAIIGWGVGSLVLQAWTARAMSGENSIYGPLTAPIALLLWLQVIAWMILLGAAVIDLLWQRQRGTHPERPKL
jgi:membrane protein